MENTNTAEFESAANNPPMPNFRSLLEKPRVRPVDADTWVATFGDGRELTVFVRDGVKQWYLAKPFADGSICRSIIADGKYCTYTSDRDLLKNCRFRGARFCGDRPFATVADLERFVGATLKAIDNDAKTFSRALKRVLCACFPGVKFSVRNSRGTGYGWIHAETPDLYGFDSALDITSFAPISGGRGAALCRIAGLERPEGWRIAERYWD